MKRTWVLLSLVWLSACGGDTSGNGTPDAGATFCQQAAARCLGLGDCAAATGDCNASQQAWIATCLPTVPGGACASATIEACYATAGCTYGATGPVCGNGTCELGEAATCPADCPAPDCSHDECTVGTPLADTCTTCTADVCAVDSYCCLTQWDAMCITQAQTLCGLCP